MYTYRLYIHPDHTYIHTVRTRCPTRVHIHMRRTDELAEYKQWTMDLLTNIAKEIYEWEKKIFSEYDLKLI